MNEASFKYTINELQAALNKAYVEIETLKSELKALKWVSKDNALRTYDGVTERLALMEKRGDYWFEQHKALKILLEQALKDSSK